MKCGHIESAINSILKQDHIEGGFEVIVADGMSDDGTRDVLDAFAKTDDRIVVVDNPKHIVPTGLNAAISAAQGKIIIRMDAHTDYAHDYLKSCIEVLYESRADNVGGPWIAKGKTFLQKTIALAFNSSFSSGGAGSPQNQL